jgi:hypothetical protein
MIGLMALRNVGVNCLYIAISDYEVEKEAQLQYTNNPLNILFVRNLFFMNIILKTMYTLSTEFVLAQVRRNTTKNLELSNPASIGNWNISYRPPNIDFFPK